ncbi:MAG TPA: hydroxymethylpyrimidine/phosphomethylpyrimidine kinase [Gammaproteobacteria bacterium]|nr:hydroxymethylpyrimidine/phosphomethylpyrimidine kinase [Gammaproteobacteria bacterium]
MQNATVPPVVLIIAGNDPSGGAGLAADIQAVTAQGAHPAPVVAAITVQDSADVAAVEAISASRVTEQARTVLADLPVKAVKLGLLGSAAVGKAVAALLREHPGLPVVVDPVLAAGGGRALADEALYHVYRRELLPLATVATPNGSEARRLTTGSTGPAGTMLLELGAVHVLVTGGDEDTPQVVNTLFSRGGGRKDFTWPRLPGRYHGSGCTLASALAALLAHGRPVEDAVQEAQRYTWSTLEAAWRLGRGQLIPNRAVRP